ncbi:GTP-binding protein, HSR1-related [Alkaliphilus metalliredigens QYMF]|uniref:Probable GTP-binding protein EngB n=1 Tax=Alkaliphilus metalliredigens (strain QYMF) TaxID=293826 RepID=ENGB_ALKMQ|nr:ribosome biogenesis GTP-binding protein YihA/YsxC [Alkaliphilus metalliredigens]A6TM67.1 RecName: Full=Probable GTP-binding protein EngB [Alkaliphilus metalliredigens QYMF]ABR47285.1 GTP-binding protein, HSR1-related [Alkaliphilus metalliredigens QYMF]
MKIKTSDIVMSAVAPKQYPEEGLPEIALAGRSNVGKSSLINTILNRKKLARVSSSPGKTRTLNFYLINKEFHLVDLPGYGYARVSKGEKSSWGKMLETYLSNRPNLYEVVLLIDIRHEPSEQDQQMYQWIRHYGYGTIVVATKSDKIARSQHQKHFKMIRDTLGMSPEDRLIPISSLKKLGIEQLWGALEDIFVENELPITIEKEAPK